MKYIIVGDGITIVGKEAFLKELSPTSERKEFEGEYLETIFVSAVVIRGNWYDPGDVLKLYGTNLFAVKRIQQFVADTFSPESIITIANDAMDGIITTLNDNTGINHARLLPRN